MHHYTIQRIGRDTDSVRHDHPVSWLAGCLALGFALLLPSSASAMTNELDAPRQGESLILGTGTQQSGTQASPQKTTTAREVREGKRQADNQPRRPQPARFDGPKGWQP